ncbi:hypothetical protein ACHAWU_002419 [Discostella pseudostelligera]|uniref:Mannose-P-dolichol utilization defect 1 protein homolog n=1 Tax=Discostella pseudostelligera TaxID=259834 RepID=A0ABD3MK48_9STRA
MGAAAALSDNGFILALATWIWESDPSPLVSPTICLDSLPLLSSPCLSRLVAKTIGIGIIFASCINKAPVIWNILQSKSVAGLSVVASYGEVILYSNAAFYNILRGNPFTAYGETFSVLLQTMVVISLIWAYEPKIGKADIVAAVAAYCTYLFGVFRVLTPNTHYILMVYNPIVLVSTRGAQIRANFVNKQTGAQSIATTSMNLAGSLVRIATTIREIGFDFHILRSYGASVTLNAILFVQILIYKANTKQFLDDLKKKKTTKKE